MHTLCLDFGNSLMKAALCNEEQLIKMWSFEKDEVHILNDIIKEFSPQKFILASVINHDASIEKVVSQDSLLHVVSNKSILNFEIKIAKPESIGADRLALMAAASHYFPNHNTLVISLGTCITYNFINQYGHFLGGAISPGLEMRFKALHHFTAQLPLYESEPNIPLIGYDTKTNIQSGVAHGMISEIDGIIEKYKQKYNHINVILTGGNSFDFASQLKNKIFADAYFLFKGLYVLSELNNK
jgi:type III pantothenate kinase